MGIYLPGSFYSSIFLLYSWGSLFGFLGKAPLTYLSFFPPWLPLLRMSLGFRVKDPPPCNGGIMEDPNI